MAAPKATWLATRTWRAQIAEGTDGNYSSEEMGKNSALKSKGRLNEEAVSSASAQARGSVGKAVAIFLLLLAVFIGLQSLLPLSTAVKIGADEGFEPAKATLSVHGYQFYTEVWNDQPPVYAFLLSQIIQNISSDIIWLRLLTVAFAIILLSAAYWAGFQTHGLLIAALTVVWVIASPGFMELSCSAMQEIPGLAPVVAALCLLLVVRPNSWHWSEAAAGMAFAFGLQIKLIGAIYLPLAGFILWQRHGFGERQYKDNAWAIRGLFSRRLLNSALIFGGSLVLAFVAIDWLIDRGAYLKHFQQSWAAHFAPPDSFEHGSPANHPFKWSVLLKNWDATLPALMGVIVLARQARHRPLVLIPGMWLVLTLMVFGVHKPWWNYYYVHHAIPLGWCAAIGITALWQGSSTGRKRWLRGLLAVACVGLLVWMSARVWLQIKGIRESPQLYTELVLPEIQRLKPFTELLYTDDPIYSFHAGIPLPPKLGVISLKRFWSGDLTTARLAEELKAAEPGLILLGNTTQDLPFSDWLHAEYRLIFQDSEHRLYANRALLARARESFVRP
jgi:hypothetical protein